MAPFVVHSIPGSPFGRSVLATLIEKGADIGFIPVSPATLKVDPHLSRHPFGRVPAIEHDGFALYETQAILRYIDRVIPEPALTPVDPRAAAHMDQLMNISDWYLFQGVNSTIGFQRIIGPQLLGMEPDLDIIKAAMPRAHTVMAELSRLLGDQSWFVGEKLTLADLMIVPHLDFLAMTPEWAELSEGRDNLNAWLERIQARESLQATTWPRVVEMASQAA
jgi:glutathione S-transferase